MKNLILKKRTIGKSVLTSLFGILLVLAKTAGQVYVPFSARMNGGKIYYNDGRYEQAAEQFAFAVADKPNSAEARIWLGMALSHLQKPLEAAIQFDSAFALDSLYFNKMLKNEDCKFQAFTSFSQATREKMNSNDTNDWQIALHYIKQALRIEPKSRQGLTYLAQLYLQLNKLEELKQSAMKIMKSDTLDPLSYTMLGLYFFNQAHWDSAHYYYWEAAKRYQANEKKTKTFLAAELKVSDTLKLNQIVTSLIAARQDRNPERLRILIQDTLKAKAKYPMLTRTVDELYLTKSELNTSYFRAGVASLHKANIEKIKEEQERYFSEAQIEFEQALRYNPQDLDAKHNLAFIYYRKGGLDNDRQAMELYEEIIKASVLFLSDSMLPLEIVDSLLVLITPDKVTQKNLPIPLELNVRIENELIKKGLDMVGSLWLYFPNLKSDWTKAPIYEQTVFLSKLSPQALENLYLLYGSAQANVAMGLKQETRVAEAKQQFETAINSFQLVLALNPKNTDALKSLGVCLSELGRKQEAFELLKKLEEIKKERQ